MDLNSVEFTEQLGAINILTIAFEIMPLLIPHKEEIGKLGELWENEQIYLSRLDEIRRGCSKHAWTRGAEQIASLPGPAFNVIKPWQYKLGLPGLEYSPFTSEEDH